MLCISPIDDDDDEEGGDGEEGDDEGDDDDAAGKFFFNPFSLCSIACDVDQHIKGFFLLGTDTIVISKYFEVV